MTTDNSTQADSGASFPRLYLEKAGETQIKHVLKAIEKVPWGITFLQLAWTAGPVTFLALQGGYYLGYGKTAPFPLFAYFAAYTIIAGLFAVGASMFHNIFRAGKAEKAEHNLLYVIDKLADLIVYFCDHRLNKLSTQERKYEAAHILLKNSHALPTSVSIAIFDITNDPKLAHTVQEIEVFRRTGLFSRAQDLVEAIKCKRDELIEGFSNSHPGMTYFLNLRLNAKAPSLKQGIPRSVGFLERTFSAIEAGDISLMTLHDAEECLILVFELINDRSIETLNFSYSGDKNLRNMAQQLEYTRSAYRLSYATLKYRLSLLKSSLIRAHQLDSLEATSETVYLAIYNAITRLSNRVQELAQKQTISTKELYLIKQYIKILSLYSLSVLATKELSQRQQQLTKAMQRWQYKTTTRTTENSELNLDKKRRGLSLKEKTIHLDNHQKLQLSTQLTERLEELIDEYPTRANYDDAVIKEFAISAILILEPYINLSHPVIQYGIESSNAANLGSLEYGISVTAKAGWTAAIVKEVEKDIGRSAEKLAEVLVKQYGETLDDDAIMFLHENYGANKNYLETIKQQTTSVKAYEAKLKELFPNIKPVNRDWLKAKTIALNLLKKAH